MKTIYKYTLDGEIDQVISIPRNGEILCLQMQHGKPCIWVLVNPDQPKEGRKFEVYGTGHPIDIEFPDLLKYIGTFQLQEGALVFHLFERIS